MQSEYVAVAPSIIMALYILVRRGISLTLPPKAHAGTQRVQG